MNDSENDKTSCIQDGYSEIDEQHHKKSCFRPEVMRPLKDALQIYDFKVGIRDFMTTPNQENADGFISLYFGKRSKEKLIKEVERVEEENPKNRSIHMVSAFLLGYYIQRKMQCDFLSKDMKNEWEFEYLWFMSCLYHDMFIGAEDRRDCEYASFDQMVRDLAKEGGKTYTIYDRKICDIQLPRPTYNRNDVKSYFQYRLERGMVDHGIKGGYVAFQKLVENFMKTRVDNGGADRFCTKNYEGDTLIWDKKQIEAFAYVSDAIIAHNIWHVSKPDDVKEYKKRGLSSFIVGDNKEKKLSVAKSPLAFFLSLIDTIEPTKAFAKPDDVEKTRSVFDNITIGVDGNCIAFGQSDMKLFKLEEWYNQKMRNMSDWLEGVGAFYDEENDRIEIRLADIE